jgi:hypothetical protein
MSKNGALKEWTSNIERKTTEISKIPNVEYEPTSNKTQLEKRNVEKLLVMECCITSKNWTSKMKVVWPTPKFFNYIFYNMNSCESLLSCKVKLIPAVENFAQKWSKNVWKIRGRTGGQQ